MHIIKELDLIKELVMHISREQLYIQSKRSCQLIKDTVKYVLLKEQACYLGFYQRSSDVHLSKGIVR